MKTEWLIYGANGYSAKLAIERATKDGLKPILAGRNEPKIQRLAEEYGLSYRAFDLSDAQVVARNLEDVKVVSHCAGPFSETAAVMMAACIHTGTHYTDITGEIDVFLHGQALGNQAKAAGVVLMPGVGLDIIPTDCLAAKLVERLPDSTSLTLGLDGGGPQFSPGTAKTAVSVVAEGMKILRNGELKTVPRTFEMRRIDFGNGEKMAGVVPWGDLGTIEYHTGIQNLTVYMPTEVTPAQRVIFPIVQRIMRLPIARNFMRKRIESKVAGPDEQERASSPTYIWGEAVNDAGQRVTARLKTPNGYEFTGNSIIHTAQSLMAYEGDGGFYTPAQFLGADAIEQFPGVSQIAFSN